MIIIFIETFYQRTFAQYQLIYTSKSKLFFKVFFGVLRVTFVVFRYVFGKERKNVNKIMW